MQVNLIEIWHNMGLLVRCVVLLLTAFGADRENIRALRAHAAHA